MSNARDEEYQLERAAHLNGGDGSTCPRCGYFTGREYRCPYCTLVGTEQEIIAHERNCPGMPSGTF
jgi:hypothetical protein